MHEPSYFLIFDRLLSTGVFWFGCYEQSDARAIFATAVVFPRTFEVARNIRAGCPARYDLLLVSEEQARCGEVGCCLGHGPYCVVASGSEAERICAAAGDISSDKWFLEEERPASGKRRLGRPPKRSLVVH